MDVWYLDDGTIACLPELALPYLHAYDAVTEQQGGRRNRRKTRVTLHVHARDRWAGDGKDEGGLPLRWRVSVLRDNATVVEADKIYGDENNP